MMGCEFLTKQEPVLISPTIPNQLLQECPEPDQLPEGIDLGQLVQADAKLALQYRECKNRLFDLQIFITQPLPKEF